MEEEDKGPEDEKSPVTNTTAVLCARCGGVIPPGASVEHVKSAFLCWRCATPLALKTFWTFDKEAAHQRHQRRAARRLERDRPAQ